MKSKSVLIILPHLGIGGTEVQTLNIISALISGGYSVSVLCLYRNIPSMVESIENLGASVLIVSPEYDNYNIKIRYPKGLNLLRFLYGALRSALNRCSPDVIHIQYMTPGATMILMLKYLFRQNNIIATTHTSADIYSKNALKLVRFLANNCLRAFQCITQKAEREYFGYSQMYHKSMLIKSGVHFTIYNSLPAYIKISETPRVISNNDIITIGVVSRLERIKGMDLVIPAFADLTSINNNIRLLIVGDGSLLGLMKSQAASYNINDKIRFVGRKSPHELQQYYDMIDIILMPSRSEGFGLTAIEGMARGCVPVVSNVGGLPEVVNFDNLLLHTSEDLNDMVLKIKDLIECPRRINELSEQSIGRAKDFSKERFNDCLLSLYNKIV